MDTFHLEPHIRYYLVDCCNAFSVGKPVKGWKNKKFPQRSVDVWINRTLGLVLKRFNYVLSNAEDLPPEVLLPTLELGETSDVWWAQPLVSMVNRKKAVRKIKKRLTGRQFPDIHCSNVGWYKGKPYLFDW
jgi:hypothetical protein